MRTRGVVTMFASVLLAVTSCKKEKKPEQTAPTGSAASAQAAGPWSLEKAAAPYRGVTLRTIGESLPPLEAMGKLKADFEKRTGITVTIEMYEHSEAVNKVMLD